MAAMTPAHRARRTSGSALHLEVIEGPGLDRQRWHLHDGFRLGRAEGSAVELADLAVSREHALIERRDDGWNLSDCRSQHGTRLNELPLAARSPAALHAGDVISIGPWRFRVVPAATDGPDADADSEPDARVDVVAQLGSLAEHRLALLLACAGEIATAPDEQALADTLAEYALLGSGYARAAVLWSADGDLALRSLRPVAAASETAFGFERALIAAAAAGEVTRLDEAQGEGEENAAQPPVRRALCAPLMLDGHAEAFLYLASHRAGRHDHDEAPTFVQALARVAALALSNLRRLHSERERATLAADIDRAREVQRRLLPDDRLPIGDLRYTLHLHPGRAVAGDIADVIALPGGEVVALLGDVSGAGFGAGLIMASVQSFLRAEFGHHADPARAMRRLNRHLHAQASRGQFVTLWLGVFDPTTRACRFVDAGHGHALRIDRDGEVVPVPTHGAIPLGIDPSAVFFSETLLLTRGEIVLLYSDGVIEQRAPDDAAFGRGRLVASILGAESPSAAVAAALSALSGHAQERAPDDDTTLLALGWSKDP